MMKTIHSESPMYETTKKQVSQIFGKGLNLNYDLLNSNTSRPTEIMRLAASVSVRPWSANPNSGITRST